MMTPPSGAAKGRRLDLGRSVGRPESGRTPGLSPGRVGRAGVPTQNLVGRQYRVGNALYGFSESVARDAEFTSNFASPHDCATRTTTKVA